MGNKVILSFEEEFSKEDVIKCSFNQKKGILLALAEELTRALFVVQFEYANPAVIKANLLAASPLQAGEVHASVNDYTLTFDPCTQVDFRHLVTVNIWKGSSLLYGIIQFITASIGSFVKAILGDDLCHMSVVVETTLKLLPSFEQLQLHGPEPTTIIFDYEGPNLRCCFCFSYHHWPADCSEP